MGLFVKGVSGNRRPFAGAWSETLEGLADDARLLVAPSRGRGLKLRRRESRAPRDRSPLRGGVD